MNGLKIEQKASHDALLRATSAEATLMNTEMECGAFSSRLILFVTYMAESRVKTLRNALKDRDGQLENLESRLSE